MSLRHVWSVVDLDEANTFPRRVKNTRKDIWKVALLKKLHIKWVIKMTDQSQAAPKEAQFKQVALWEAYILQCISTWYWWLSTYIWRKMGL